MALKVVRNVNKGKRRTKKYHFKVGDPVVFKWCGDRDYGFISEHTKTKDGYASYTIRATGLTGCIYYDMEMDDADDPYSYVSSVLSKSITQRELDNIDKHKADRLAHSKLGETTINGYSKKPKVKKSTATKSKIKKPKVNPKLNTAIEKQKDFLKGKHNDFF